MLDWIYFIIEIESLNISNSAAIVGIISIGKYVSIIFKSDNVLFFPFDSDGDFYIFKEHHKDGIPNTVNIEEVITPKENSMIVFDGWKYHASSNPIEDQTRMTINWTIKYD